MLADMFLGAGGMFKSGQLNGFLEQFKETMEEGDENLGIPVLDPFMSKHEHIDLEEDELFSAEGHLKNLRIDGLSNYTVKQADFPLAGFKAKVALLFHEINIETRYNMTGTFLDENSFNGRGNLALVIKRLNVTADLQLQIQEGRLYVSNLELQTRVREFDCNISELYVNDDLSEDISETITEEAPNFLKENQNLISRYVGKILKNVINDILKKYTLVNLLDMIGG
ncbi:uncharacterized protein LOC122572416 [Bombus pyrosoma]|uniref:uncharacterized protein LOC122572416 n=1 Tax=Bombus pyrosoma TaxID=396416 RepID=UPI001CB8CB60|nr:uncharacterized protein LOC122572416 [Bombus pyrosoma]XP_043593291.1 uncharacterized protein LOC122572416 [Bombus pyrosoma]XP_043593292.1 uncharacterized protein LOC122572416 [Bombus pyrosoma]